MTLVLHGKGLLLKIENYSNVYIYIHICVCTYMYLERETFIYKWLFQLDFFKSLHGKRMAITKHPL